VPISDVAMNVTGTQVSQAALQNLEDLKPMQMKLQAQFLRKSLNAQEDQANELMKLLDGKGKTLDIRV